MQIGILGLGLIFFLSGAKNLKDSGISFGRYKDKDKSLPESGKKAAATFVKAADKEKGQLIFSHRQFGYGLLLMFVGLLVLIYYLVTVL